MAKLSLGKESVAKVQGEIPALLRQTNRAVVFIAMDEEGEIHGGMAGELSDEDRGNKPSEARELAALIMVIRHELEQNGFNFKGITCSTELDS